MAIIVRHKEHKGIYVLVGTSYSYFKDSRPSFLGGTLFPHEEEGLFKLYKTALKSADILETLEYKPTEPLYLSWVTLDIHKVFCNSLYSFVDTFK